MYKLRVYYLRVFIELKQLFPQISREVSYCFNIKRYMYEINIPEGIMFLCITVEFCGLRTKVSLPHFIRQLAQILWV